MPHRTPQDGGCWYCSTDDGEMYFSGEFDTYLHGSCLTLALKSDPNDREAKIIAEELVTWS